MHVYGDAQTVGPVQPRPPHWPHSACVAVDTALVAVVAAVVVVLAVAVTVLVAGTVVPAAAASRLCTVSYAGLVVRLAQYRHASPWPEKVLGIHEYASSKSLVLSAGVS